MIVTVIGTAATPLIVALQISALIGSSDVSYSEQRVIAAAIVT